MVIEHRDTKTIVEKQRIALHEAQRWKENAKPWDQWADNVARMADRLNQPFLKALDIQPGQHVLDLASGPGEPALSMRKAIGDAPALLVATDLIPEMLMALRKRDRESGKGDIEVVATDMESLPFKQKSFDRISCRFGIMFLSNPLKALEDCYNILKLKGQIGFLVFGPLKENSLHNVLHEAVQDVFGFSEKENSYSPFRYASSLEDEHGAESLESMMEKIGYKSLKSETLRIEKYIPGESSFWQQQLEMSYSYYLKTKSEDSLFRLDDNIRGRFENTRSEKGIPITMNARIITGIKT